MTDKHCPRCGETRPLGEYNVCVPCAAACGWDPACKACDVEDRGGATDLPHVATCDPGMRARCCPDQLPHDGHEWYQDNILRKECPGRRGIDTGQPARDMAADLHGAEWKLRDVFEAGRRAAAEEIGAELERLRAENADYRKLFEIQWDRAMKAGELWRAEDPQARALVMPDLGAWLMKRADEARSKVARRILARARALQADMDGDPNLAADPAIAGEIEGLWAAVRIADERTWEQSGWEAKRG